MMAQHVKLQASALKELRRVDERLMSYNVEMTEVTAEHFGRHTPGNRSREKSSSRLSRALLSWEI